MSGFWVQHQVSLIVFLGVLALIALGNWRAWRRLGSYRLPDRWPSVSVLVPARNEEDNIGPCVTSLVRQDYAGLEVLVLDDASTDGTAAALAALAGSAASGRLTVLVGKPLPEGWLGKHWACHQLAQAARGDLLLFVDADTYHEPSAVRHAVAALLAERADMVSALPRQIMGTWAEQLLIPIIPWALFSFLPLPLAYRVKWRVLAAAVGQFLLFRRAAYESIGGHAAVCRHAADDLALARRAAARGLRWRLLDGDPLVRCRMYRSAREVIDGLSKNLFAAFDYRALPFVFVWTWLLIVLCGPPVELLLKVLFPSLRLSIGLALGGIGAALLLWLLFHLRFGLPLAFLPLYPARIALAVAVSFRSLVLSRAGRATWKGRTLARDASG